MRRDMDLIRRIMLTVEDAPLGQDPNLEALPIDRAFLAEHVQLTIDAGLLDGEVFNSLSSEPAEFIIRRITMEGHEFLDSVRDQGVWNETKAVIVSKGGGLTFDVVKSVATALIKQAIGLPGS